MKNDFWVEESSEKPSICQKRKRRVGKKKIEFIGWGSRPLIEFLEAIGQDTTEKKHSQREVAAIITKYINEKGLASAEKRKKVLCDEWLYALFGKKSISRIKIYDLLEEHFAENHDDSEDEFTDSSEEEDYREKVSKNGPIKKVPKTPKSCFSAVTMENIKLVYLKKSLIQEFLKVPETCENKIVGSFVRMKSDPNDIYQKNRFQLQLVTGVERSSGNGDDGIEITLRVANFFKDVPISMLSDDNFSAEEIEDVRDRIKSGLLKRLTVNELELKAQMLHVDITKHWIAKEISLLQKLIDRANEKGWRRELFGYLERRKILQSPPEQEKLLLKPPEVIAEELESEVATAFASEKAEGSGTSPKSILRNNSDVSSTDASGSGDTVAPSQVIFSNSHPPKGQNDCVSDIVPDKTPNADQTVDTLQQGTPIVNATIDGSQRESQAVCSKEEKNVQEKAQLPLTTTEVIDLSDDESDDDDALKGKNQNIGESPNDTIWYYVDPQGQKRGPFSLYVLKRWSDANYFHLGFKVWKSGHMLPDEGVLLVDLLRRTFPY